MKDQICEWDYAVEIGGAYFEHARCLGLGLPQPPRCFVDNVYFDLLGAAQQNAIADYRKLVADAEFYIGY
jgi:hypothetical protein